MNSYDQKHYWNHIPMEELLPVVAKLAERYTAGESTSVAYEKAEQLMGAVLYCIREAEYAEEAKECGKDSRECGQGDRLYGKLHSSCSMSCDEEERVAKNNETNYIAACPKGMSVQRAYEIGLACVERKVKKALALYNEMQTYFDSYGNRCLYDTFVKGIPEFFKWYDIRFAPQDTILTLDYPVLDDLSAYTGIDRIYEYLVCIRKEQEFLCSFPRAEVIDLLAKYNPAYEDMIDNVCGAVSESKSRMC